MENLEVITIVAASVGAIITPIITVLIIHWIMPTKKDLKDLSDKVDSNYKELSEKIDNNYRESSNKMDSNYKDLSNRSESVK